MRTFPHKVQTKEQWLREHELCGPKRRVEHWHPEGKVVRLICPCEAILVLIEKAEVTP